MWFNVWWMVVNKNYNNEKDKNILLSKLGFSEYNFIWTKSLDEATLSSENSDLAIAYKNDYTLVLSLQELEIDYDLMIELSKNYDVLFFIAWDTWDVYVLQKMEKWNIKREYMVSCIKSMVKPNFS